jgi:uncharacterized protein YjiS (DUF1127 family)
MPSKHSYAVGFLFRAIAEALRCRRDQRVLAAMSERELRDLGVDRSQIPGLTHDLLRRDARNRW